MQQNRNGMANEQFKVLRYLSAVFPSLRSPSAPQHRYACRHHLTARQQLAVHRAYVRCDVQSGASARWHAATQYRSTVHWPLFPLGRQKDLQLGRLDHVSVFGLRRLAFEMWLLMVTAHYWQYSSRQIIRGRISDGWLHKSIKQLPIASWPREPMQEYQKFSKVMILRSKR